MEDRGGNWRELVPRTRNLRSEQVPQWCGGCGTGELRCARALLERALEDLRGPSGEASLATDSCD